VNQLVLPGYCTEEHQCPRTAQRLIHAVRRGQDESSSELGQHVHDNYPRTFNFLDIDAGIHKRATGVLRIVEHKLPGQTLSRSQCDVLPLLANALVLLAKSGLIEPRTSGVFQAAGFAPFAEMELRRMNALGELSKPVVLSGRPLDLFLTGELF
jgi:hypothetical protein